MSGGYIQSEIVEANRLRSQEALSGNNDNPAQWTNVLSDVYELNPGDKVSLYSAFISERGAGSAKTIEIKGAPLGKEKTFKYITEEITTEKITNRKFSSTVTLNTETKSLRDNIANLTIGYYKNTNGTGYTTLPRKFFKNMGDGGQPEGTGDPVVPPVVPYTTEQDISSNGYISPIPSEAIPFFIKGDYYRSVYGSSDVSGDNIVRVKNDNTKYTLFISQYSLLGRKTGTSINGGLGPEPEDSYTVEPEFRQYFRYRQLLPIEVEKGFNSAQFIAGSLTEKLQQVVKTEDLVFSEDPANLETANSTANIKVSKIAESNTYKTFNCMTLADFTETQYNAAIADPPTGTPFWNNFQIIGMKRPELFEKGELINLNVEDNAVLENTVVYNASANTGFDLDIVNVHYDPVSFPSFDLSDFGKVLITGTPEAPIDPYTATITNITVNAPDSLMQFTFDGAIDSPPANGTEFTLKFYSKTIPTKSDRLLGSRLRVAYDITVANEPFRTNIPYTKDNLKILKDYLESQELYPEIWESWNASGAGDDASAFSYGDGTYYDETHTIDNTRFFHINTIPNVDMVEVDYVTNSKKTFNTTVDELEVNAGETSFRVEYDPASDPDLSIPPHTVSYSIPSRGINNVAVSDATYLTAPIDALELTVPALPTNIFLEDSVIIKYTSSTVENQYLLDHTMLGSSLLRPTNADPTRENDVMRYSKLFLVYFNKADKDTYYDEPNLEANQLTYGCFGKESGEVDGITMDFINIFPNVNKSATDVGGPFVMETPNWVNSLGVDEVEVGRKFGYDMHFTAPCQPAIALFNGTRTGVNYYGEQFPKTFILNDWGNANNASQTVHTNNLGYINRRYVGADNPKVNWDGEHFNFSDLHTSENLSARGPDGGYYAEDNDPGDTTKNIYLSSDVPSDEGSIIYKINPLQDINEYCPAISPYQLQYELFTRSGSAGPGVQVGQPFNRNYEPYTIYDSKSGIFFEDMGYDSDTWNDGLWGIMGFTYEQFNGTDNNRLKRVDNTNINSLKSPTTNAEIKITNTKNWVTNDQGVPYFSDNIPCPFSYYRYAESGVYEPAPDNDVTFILKYPVINVKSQSITLTAERFPTSMIKGYYTIRSDIVPRSIFVGGRSNITNMPILGIVNKENPQSDYYFGGESDIEFTIGQPIKMSSITVGIFDPDGSYANVNNSSSVLFKIQRQVNTSFNIVEDILGKKNKAKI